MSNKNIEIRFTNDGSHTLFLPDLNESYHSHFGAVQESEYVYIQQGLDFWFQQNSTSKSCHVFELGFGTGLDALLVRHYAKHFQKQIYMDVLDNNYLDKSIWNKLNYASRFSHLDISEFHQIHEAELNVAKDLSPLFTMHKIDFDYTIWTPNKLYDVLFYDAFGPDKQPEMWTETSLQKAYNMLSENGIFVTYASKGEVRRNLQKLGFEVERLPGPPGKKHMTRGLKSR